MDEIIEHQPARRKLVDLPAEMMLLPRDHRDFPVPKFVHWEDGKPDFRIIKKGWIQECYRSNRCWLCGGFMGKRKWFVIGPMCCVNHVSAEPPSHRLCAEFAAKNCPFLTRPLASRNSRDLPEHLAAPGVMLERNPGVTAIWETSKYSAFKPPGGGLLFDVGEPNAVSFWREGRKATRREVEDSIISGLDVLQSMAVAEGPPAMAELTAALEAVTILLAETYKGDQADG